MVQRIIQDCPPHCQAILEIGPGTGALTQGLAQLGPPLVVVEKDPRFQATLAQMVKPEALIIADALTLDYHQLYQRHWGGEGGLWLVSNLPYHISGPLVARLLALPFVQAMTLMMQKEVGQKICPPEGTKNAASRLWALGQTYFAIKQLATVAPGAFFPPPKVHSIVLSLQRRADPGIAMADFAPLAQFARQLFAHPRKQLVKVLGAFYPPGDVLSQLKSLGLSATLRSERLHLHHVQTLFKHLYQPSPLSQ